MDQRQKAIQIVKKLRVHGYQSYFCGGSVRDFLLGHSPKDYDIVTNATPPQLKRIFSHTIAIGEKFGVIQVLIGEDSFEIATFRRDGLYEDGRRPGTVKFCCEKEDALRRDFTINGMFFDPLSQIVIDYVAGQKDLEKKIIKTIGEPRERFLEDHLRIMRAIRFSSQLNFQIESQTWKAVCSMAHLIKNVSDERISDELRKMLCGQHPEKALSLLHQSGLLSHILPEISITKFQNALRMFKIGAPIASYKLAFSLLMLILKKNNATSVLSLCRQLRLSNKVTKTILNLLAWYRQFDKITSLTVASAKRIVRLSDFDLFLELYRLVILAGDQDRKKIYSYLEEKKKLWNSQDLSPVPFVNGQDLIQLGLSPGPIFKKILDFMEEQQLEGKISSRQQALEYLHLKFVEEFVEGNNIESKKNA